MLRQEKERELLEDNPALAFPYNLLPSAQPSPDPEPSNSNSVPKPQKKSRTSIANGKEKERANGTASTSSNTKRRPKKTPRTEPEAPYSNMNAPPHEDLQWPVPNNGPNGHGEESTQNHQRRSSRNGMPSVSAPLPPPPPATANGHPVDFSQPQPPQYTPEGGYDLDSIHSPPHESESRSQTPPYGSGGPSWPGQFTGPASGFLRGTVAPYANSQNPGRTIYSQTNRPD